MEEICRDQIEHTLTVNPDVAKVIGFMRHNIQYHDLLNVARWVAEIAPLIWPDAIRKDAPPGVSAPIDYSWRKLPPKDGQTSLESSQVSS